MRPRRTDQGAQAYGILKVVRRIRTGWSQRSRATLRQLRVMVRIPCAPRELESMALFVPPDSAPEKVGNVRGPDACAQPVLTGRVRSPVHPVS
jgi:hypothetical protein